MITVPLSEIILNTHRCSVCKGVADYLVVPEDTVNVYGYMCESCWNKLRNKEENNGREAGED